MPSGRYMALSQCCPMERALTSGTKKAPSPRKVPTHHFYVSTLLLCDPSPSLSGKGRRESASGGENDRSVTLHSDPKTEAHRQRLSSVVAADLLPSLEGVELESSGKVNTNTQKHSRHLDISSVFSLFFKNSRQCLMLSFSIQPMPW